MNESIKAGANIHAGDGGYGEGTQEGYDAFVKVRNKSLAQGRIRDLAEQAMATLPAIEGSLSHTYFDKEKFAELIVRECAGLFPNVYVEIENEYGHTPVIAADYIKKHFGVEE